MAPGAEAEEKAERPVTGVRVRRTAGYARRVEVDHVLVATRDLTEAAEELETRHGLRSVEGGRHPGFGTANRIIPLGGAYIELVAVADPTEARESVFGRWVGSAAADLLRPLGWAVRTDGLDEVARRRGLVVAAGERVTPTGERLAWRAAGVEQAAAEPSLPFFIEWEPGSPFPGAAGAVSPASLERLSLVGDPARVASWLDGNVLPVDVLPGQAAVTAVVVRSTVGRVVLEPIA